MIMKIMTFNIHHCGIHPEDVIDFNAFAETISRFSPDIVGMNEVRDKGEDLDYAAQPEILSKLTGMKYYYFAQTLKFDGVNPYGNAILSRYPIVNAEVIPIPDPEVKTGDKYYETRNILKVKLECGLTVLISHWGLNDDELMNAQRTVLKNIEEEKCVLMGDFNIHPDNELLSPIREKMCDTAEVFDKELFSFPSDAPVEKIDYIFTSKDIKVESADIPAVTTSDHRPYIAEITF